MTDILKLECAIKVDDIQGYFDEMHYATRECEETPTYQVIGYEKESPEDGCIPLATCWIEEDAEYIAKRLEAFENIKRRIEQGSTLGIIESIKQFIKDVELS